MTAPEGRREAGASPSAQADAETPLFVGIEGQSLVIRVGIGTLAFAVSQTEDGFKITDADLAADEIVRELRREEEDGTTVVHKLLDRAAFDAWENGGEGFLECDEDEPYDYHDGPLSTYDANDGTEGSR